MPAGRPVAAAAPFGDETGHCVGRYDRRDGTRSNVPEGRSVPGRFRRSARSVKPRLERPIPVDGFNACQLPVDEIVASKDRRDPGEGSGSWRFEPTKLGRDQLLVDAVCPVFATKAASSSRPRFRLLRCRSCRRFVGIERRMILFVGIERNKSGKHARNARRP